MKSRVSGISKYRLHSILELIQERQFICKRRGRWRSETIKLVHEGRFDECVVW